MNVPGDPFNADQPARPADSARFRKSFSPENGSAGRPGKPASLLRVWFGVGDEVTRKMYALSGVGLMLFKYIVEMGMIFLYTGQWLTPWGFLNPLLSDRVSLLQPGPEWLGWALFAWNLPFVWIAFSMSVRRAANAGGSPWIGLLVLIPLVNLIVMVTLALVPVGLVHRWVVESPVNIDRREVSPEYRHTLLAIGLGLLVGLAMLGISVYAFDLYGATLFFGTPLLMGASAGFIYNRPYSRSWGGTVGVSLLLMSAAGGVLLVFALEGVICLVMAAPLVVPLGLVGGAVGKSIADATQTSLPQTLSSLLVLPLLAGAEALYHPSAEHVVLTSVEIDARPEIVWQHVIEFPNLAEPDEWYFRAGVSCPMRARIDGRGVGAVRHCEFTTGDFVEPITTWDEPRRLAFDVIEQPDPMRELSPYRHVHPPHLKGQALQSRRGEFRLVPLPGGRTRLEGRTWYTFEMFPQNYWTLWSQACIHRIHNRVLKHIKRLSEATSST